MNDTTYTAFFDELEKIGKNFGLAGVQAIVRTPSHMIQNEASRLSGQAGSIKNTILNAERSTAAQQLARDAKHSRLQQLLQEGKFNPQIHDAKEFMKSEKIIPKQPVVSAPVDKASTKILGPRAPDTVVDAVKNTAPKRKPSYRRKKPSAAQPSVPPQSPWGARLRNAAAMTGLGAAGVGAGYEMAPNAQG
jgi:hypothetical protein